MKDPDDDDKAASPAIPVLEGDAADLSEAWKYYTWMEATENHFLPSSGGLEDQDEMLINNIFKIRASVRRMKGK